jgi:hypothetical protein
MHSVGQSYPPHAYACAEVPAYKQVRCVKDKIRKLATAQEVVGVRNNYPEIYGSCMRNTNNGENTKAINTFYHKATTAIRFPLQFLLRFSVFVDPINPSYPPKSGFRQKTTT